MGNDHGGRPAIPEKNPNPSVSRPVQQNHLLPVGLSSSPALTTDPAGDAAIPHPAFLAYPCRVPLDPAEGLARLRALRQLCGQRGSCLALFKAA